MKSALSLFVHLAQKWWWLLLLVGLLEALNAEFGEYVLLQFRDHQSFPLAGFGISLSIVLSLLIPIALMCVLLTLVATGSNAWANFRNHFGQLLIEYLRVYGKVFLWGFLLIIPGIVKFVRYSLVPFVVFFDRRYQNDQTDALALSSALTRGRFWKLTFYLIAAQLAPAVSWLLFGDIRFSERPMLATVNLIWVVAVEIMVFCLIYLEYKQGSKDLERELA